MLSLNDICSHQTAYGRLAPIICQGLRGIAPKHDREDGGKASINNLIIMQRQYAWAKHTGAKEIQLPKDASVLDICFQIIYTLLRRQ